MRESLEEEELKERLEQLRAEHAAESVYGLLLYKNVKEANDIALKLLQVVTRSSPLNDDDPFYFQKYVEEINGFTSLAKAYDSALRWHSMPEDERRLLLDRVVYGNEDSDDFVSLAKAYESVLKLPNTPKDEQQQPVGAVDNKETNSEEDIHMYFRYADAMAFTAIGDAAAAIEKMF